MRGPVPWAAILPELPELRQAMRRGIPEISHILNLTIMEFKTLTNIQSAFDRIRLVVVLVLAYATIIAALVIDLGPVRRRRNVYRDKVGSMTKKQVERIVTESYVDRQATDAAKKARRAAKKAGQDPEAAYKAAYDAYVAQSAHAGRHDEGPAGSGAGTTKVTEVAEGAATSGAGKGGRGILFGKRAKDRAQGTPVDEAVQAAEPEAPAQAEAEIDEAERARREAAAKAAREFAASRRSGTGK